MSLPPGTQIGPYTIEAAIGAGGMGEVYRARDTKLQRYVAIKVLPRSVVADRDRLARLRREAMLLATVQHAGVGHIHGLEETGDVTALVLELIDGDDLAAKLRRGPVAIAEALEIAKQIASALEAIHNVGIVHRDLKPANIKITESGVVKVLDFGLAKDESTASTETELLNSPTVSFAGTEAGVILGTAPYMSPEQARGKHVDRRTDVWALGCILFEMLSGRRAFGGETATDTIAAVVSKDPNWDALPIGTPSALLVLLKRCLEKRATARLDSAIAFRMAVDDISLIPANDSPNIVRQGTQHYSSRLAWLALTLIPIAVLGGLVLKRPPVPTPSDQIRFVVDPPVGSTHLTGTGFEMSPDGKKLMFVAQAEDTLTRIFIRDFSEPTAETLNGTEGATAPFWSPDSRAIGFTLRRTLYRLDLDTGRLRKLCDIPERLEIAPASWGPRGEIVFAAGRRSLFRVAETGGTPTAVPPARDITADGVQTAPFFLPDGHRVLVYARERAALTTGEIWVVDLNGSPSKMIANSAGGAAFVDGFLLTTSEAPRRLIAQPFNVQSLQLEGQPTVLRERLTTPTTGGRSGFSVSKNGILAAERELVEVHQLQWITRSGSVTSDLGPARFVHEFALSPDGSQVAAVIFDQNQQRDVWLLTDRQQRRLTTTGRTVSPAWSHDGKALYFETLPGPRLERLIIGSGKIDEVDNPYHLRGVRLTRDYMLGWPSEKPITTTVSATQKPNQVIRNIPNSRQAQISPNQQWVAFSRNGAAGIEVFVESVSTSSESINVSRGTGFGPVWSHDGGELYFEGQDGVMAVRVTELTDGIHFSDPEKLFAVRTQKLTLNDPLNFAVAQNGKFLVNTLISQSSSVPIEVTLNWSAGLRK